MWDGIETTSKIWAGYPDLQVVICTAYSDYSWEEMLSILGFSDRLLILKKPFDNIEVLQLAIAMTEKWRLHQQVKVRLDDLERMVRSTLLLQVPGSQLERQADTILLGISLGRASRYPGPTKTLAGSDPCPCRRKFFAAKIKLCGNKIRGPIVLFGRRPRLAAWRRSARPSFSAFSDL
jgi:hypothetical protein